MRICFVGPASSVHMAKWCGWFLKNGHEVHLVSFEKNEITGVIQHYISAGTNPWDNELNKIKYLFSSKKILNVLNKIRPDVVNVHYASSYGAAVALSGYKNYILSIWGSDIYIFPKKSLFHKTLLKYSLSKANRLFSTSNAMAKEASKYTKKKFDITPFGIDTTLFNPNKRNRIEFDKEELIVGTVKGLSDVYGISDILKAIEIIKKNTSIPIHLRIAGKGKQEDEYHNMARKLEIDDITTWLGYISQEDAAIEWANMDIALIPSISESFGVAAIEAQASGTVVIISDADGLLEATSPGSSSIVVHKNNPQEIANAIIKLVEIPEKMIEMGLVGRKYVMENYSIEHCFTHIENIFEQEMLSNS